MIAAAANVAAAGLAERAGTPIGFVTFLRVGLPVTLISIAMATGYVAAPLRRTLRRERMPDSIVKETLREIEPLDADELIGPAARRVIDAGLPALPAVEQDGRFAGIFGEREFMAALFPGYVGELASAAMISRSVDETIERRASAPWSRSAAT